MWQGTSGYAEKYWTTIQPRSKGPISLSRPSQRGGRTQMTTRSAVAAEELKQGIPRKDLASRRYGNWTGKPELKFRTLTLDQPLPTETR